MMRITYGEYSKARDLGKYPPNPLPKPTTVIKHKMDTMTVQGVKVRIHQGLTKNAKDLIKLSVFTPYSPKFSSSDEAAYFYNGWRLANGLGKTTDERLIKPIRHVKEYEPLSD
jgi:hypothetical protein